MPGAENINSPTTIKKEIGSEDDAENVMPPPSSPIKIDERTIKREAFEKTKRIEKQTRQYSRPRPWICGLCGEDMYPDIRKHFNTLPHQLAQSNALLDVLPRDCKEIIIAVSYRRRVDASHLKKEMSCYGPVEKIIMDQPVVGSHIVIFTDSRSVAALKNSRPLYVSGCVASAQAARPSVRLNSAQVNDSDRGVRLNSFHRELMSIIEHEGRFFHQLCYMSHALRPSEDECYEIKRVFEDVIPSKKITGTLMMSGLELSGAVIEIAVHFQGKAGTSQVDSFLKEMEKDIDYFASNVKVDKSVPELKFKHRKRGFLVRIAINDFIAVQRNVLLNLYGNLHSGMKCLAYFVQYWALVHDLTGPEGLTPLAIIVLVIYYLQQLPDPVLPSVIKLQETVTPFMINGWNCSFERDKTKIPPSRNRYTLRQLISGFFAHYSKFNFHAFIISPHLGKNLRKSLFQNFNEIPETLQTYKIKYLKNNAEVKKNREEMCDPMKMCLQDPFNLAVNLTSSTSVENMDRFQMCCEHTRSVFDSEQLALRKVLKRSLERIPKRFFEESEARRVDAANEIVVLKEEKKPPVLVDLSDDESDDEYPVMIEGSHVSRATTKTPVSEDGYGAPPSSVNTEQSLVKTVHVNWRECQSAGKRDSMSTLEADDEYDDASEMEAEDDNYSLDYDDDMGEGKSDGQQSAKKESMRNSPNINPFHQNLVESNDKFMSDVTNWSKGDQGESEKNDSMEVNESRTNKRTFDKSLQDSDSDSDSDYEANKKARTMK